MMLLKDPDAILPYGVQWSVFMAGLPDQTIVSAEWVYDEVDGGIEVDDEGLQADLHFAVVSGGTPGSTYRLTSRITTSAGYVNDSTITLLIQDA